MLVKVREDRSVQNLACYLALGVDCDGEREVLGIWWQETEGAKFWLAVLNDLQPPRRRGRPDRLRRRPQGLPRGDRGRRSRRPGCRPASCTSSARQLRYVNYRDLKKVASALRPIYTAANADQALVELERFDGRVGRPLPGHRAGLARRLGARHPVPRRCPKTSASAVYTTNTIEGLHRQIRKAIKTRGHFPDQQAATKLIYLAIIRPTPSGSATAPGQPHAPP